MRNVKAVIEAIRDGRFQGNATALMVVMVITAIIFARSLFGDFVCDDRPLLVNNESQLSLSNLPSYFTHGTWYHTKERFIDYYRPLSLVTLVLIHQITGENPFGFHLVGLGIHIVSSILVFFILRKLTRGEFLTALPGSLFFALFPIHAEAVSWINGIFDLQSTLFLLCAFLAYVKYAEKGRKVFFFSSVFFFLCSIFSKESGLLFPLTIAAYDYFFTRKIYVRRLFAFFLATVMYYFIMHLTLGETSSVNTVQLSADAFKRLFQFAGGYIKLLFVPWPPVFYTMTPGQHFNSPGVIISCVAFTLMVLFLRKDRIALLGLCWFLAGLLLPLALAFRSVNNALFAQRYLYMPSVGFVIMLASITSHLEKYRKQVTVSIGAVIVIFGLLSFRAIGNWRNDETFYSMVIRTAPANGGAYVGLADYYMRNSRPEEAINALMTSLRLVPAKEKPSVYAKIALWYGERGDTERSIYYYQKLLDLEPANSTALAGIGNNYFMKGKNEKALSYYQEAIAADPKNYEACYNLALAYERLGEKGKAASYYALFINAAPEQGYTATKNAARAAMTRLR